MDELEQTLKRERENARVLSHVISKFRYILRATSYKAILLMRAAFLVVLSFLLHPLKVLFTKTTTNNTTNNSRRGFRRRRFLRASISRETETTPPSCQCRRLSKDETMWLFPHRIDPMFEDDDEENTKLNNVRSGRSERSCHVWFENGYV